MRKDGVEIIRLGRKIGVPFVAVVFFLMLLYLLLRGISVFTGQTISAFTVGEPSEDTLTKSFSGLILRNEEVVYAEESGMVQFMRSPGERIPKSTLVLVSDSTGQLQEKLKALSARAEELSDEDYLKIREELVRVREEYDPLHHETAIRQKTELEGFLYTLILKEGGEEIRSELGNEGLTDHYSDLSGFLYLSEDGLEGAEPGQLTREAFTEEPVQYKRKSGDTVSRGDFLYKLITDNRFRLVFPLTDSEKAGLAGKTTLSVTMPDDEVLSGSFEIITLADGTSAGVLTFAKYGLNYLDTRLISFRILDKEVKGFKIPETSVTKKSFFVILRDFVQTSGADRTRGVLVETMEGAEFIAVSAYENTGGDTGELIIGENVAYITGEGLAAGQVLLLETEDPVTGAVRTERTTLGVMASLEGVYQINAGYCVFRPVLRLKNSVESSYIMVSSEIAYSIRSLDRIVMDASRVKENEIVFE